VSQVFPCAPPLSQQSARRESRSADRAALLRCESPGHVRSMRVEWQYAVVQIESDEIV
jgi:hypothetical protein